jgi:hypothetical protein
MISCGEFTATEAKWEGIGYLMESAGAVFRAPVADPVT